MILQRIIKFFSNFSDYIFKIIIIGNPGVGKSCLLIRYIDDSYSEGYSATIGVDFKLKTITINDKQVKLQIWDTAGQERFQTITSSYYHNANGVIVVYDVTNRESFEAVRKWLDDVARLSQPDICKLIIGNKSDMGKFREVPTKEGKNLAKTLGIPYLETSAKDSTNVEEVFTKMANAIFEKRSTKALDAGTKTLVLSEGKVVQEKKGCC